MDTVLLDPCKSFTSFGCCIAPTNDQVTLHINNKLVSLSGKEIPSHKKGANESFQCLSCQCLESIANIETEAVRNFPASPVWLSVSLSSFVIFCGEIPGNDS